MPSAENPLIVQSDHTVLAETASPLYGEARGLLCRFAELVKSPEHIHTYRISPLSIWNAAAVGMTLDDIRQTLVRYSKYPVPENILSELEHTYQRYGRVVLRPGPEPARLELEILDGSLRRQFTLDPKIAPLFLEKLGESKFLIWSKDRGLLKQALIKRGSPVVDLAGYTTGDPCPIALRETARSGTPFTLRDYQHQAIDAFHQSGTARGGNGVIVLPCGSGKTVVGLGVMARLGFQTLILTTGVTSVHQWIREILDKTELTPDQVGEYSGMEKHLRPVTVATYNILTHFRPKDGAFAHFDLLNAANWGLILYDEVHLLPAPLFRMTADLQARRRLGLTATLVREDGQEEDVFSLIGPKRYETPWKELESKGWIAEASCHELRVAFPEEEKFAYAGADERAKFRLAAENPAKIEVVRELLGRHAGEPTLVIGHYVDQLKKIAKTLDLPLITGQTSNARRDVLYKEFREGQVRALVVSRVANFSIDLPEARILVEVSGLFGSRQEEAQRLGRILRPKAAGQTAMFYALVTPNTVEQDFARHRQMFLAEQGYAYQIQAWLAEASAVPA